MNERFLAIVNPAAGGGRASKLAAQTLAGLLAEGGGWGSRETQAAGDATRIAREAYREGWRKFIAVGGDGTSFEVVNGLFPECLRGERPAIGFLPLGTGNSFLKDFTQNGAAGAAEAIVAERKRRCDVMRLVYNGGGVFLIKLLTFW